MPRKKTYFRKVPGKAGQTGGYMTYTAPTWHQLFAGNQPPMRWAMKKKKAQVVPKVKKKKKNY